MSFETDSQSNFYFYDCGSIKYRSLCLSGQPDLGFFTVKKFISLTFSTVLALSTVAMASQPSYAWDRYYHHHHYYGGRNHGGDVGAAIAGGIIGGAIIGAMTAPRPAYVYSQAHVRWCYNRYRSYRASDNSFQPINGPRQQCYSPYD
jgi:hypothetical protein